MCLSFSPLLTHYELSFGSCLLQQHYWSSRQKTELITGDKHHPTDCFPYLKLVCRFTKTITTFGTSERIYKYLVSVLASWQGASNSPLIYWVMRVIGTSYTELLNQLGTFADSPGTEAESLTADMCSQERYNPRSHPSQRPAWLLWGLWVSLQPSQQACGFKEPRVQYTRPPNTLSPLFGSLWLATVYNSSQSMTVCVHRLSFISSSSKYIRSPALSRARLGPEDITLTKTARLPAHSRSHMTPIALWNG